MRLTEAESKVLEWLRDTVSGRVFGSLTISHRPGNGITAEQIMLEYKRTET